jgi:hypothetical protein
MQPGGEQDMISPNGVRAGGVRVVHADMPDQVVEAFVDVGGQLVQVVNVRVPQQRRPEGDHP